MVIPKHVLESRVKAILGAVSSPREGESGGHPLQHLTSGRLPAKLVHEPSEAHINAKMHICWARRGRINDSKAKQSSRLVRPV